MLMKPTTFVLLGPSLAVRRRVQALGEASPDHSERPGPAHTFRLGKLAVSAAGGGRSRPLAARKEDTLAFWAQGPVRLDEGITLERTLTTPAASLGKRNGLVAFGVHVAAIFGARRVNLGSHRNPQSSP